MIRISFDLGNFFFTTHPGEVKKAAAAAAAENITMAEVNWCGIRAGAYGEKGMRRQMEDETLGVWCLFGALRIPGWTLQMEG